MASIFDSLAYENSSIPDSVRRAAQGELDYQKAIKNKLPLAVEGSGIPEGVRKAAQGYLDKASAPAPQAAPPVADPWMQGQRTIPEGMFGKAASAIGKAGAKVIPAVGGLSALYEAGDILNNKYGYGAYQNFKNAAEEGRTRQAMEADPELANRGQETVNRITGNAMQGVADLLPQYQGGQGQPQPQGLTQEELNAQNPNDVMDTPQQSPMEVPPVEQTPVGPVTQAAPTTVRQAAAKTTQDLETQRQAVEQGALKGLSTGAVSRPEFAAEIAKMDAQKAGVTLTPEQLKKATTDELTSMKSMDNNEVSRYISYALAAAGVLATVLDKSGAAGEAFSQSFNKQLDRNLQAGLMNQKQKAAAAKLAQEERLQTAGLAIKSRQADTQEKSVEQTGLYQQGTLKQRAEQARGAEALGYARINSADARTASTNELRRQALDQSQRQFDLNLDLRRDMFDTDKEYKAAIAKAKADANAIQAAKVTKGNAPKGIDITTKDAQGLVDAAAGSQGLSVDKATKGALAQSVRVYAKNHPEEFARDPNGVVLGVIRQKGSPYQQGQPRLGGLLSPQVTQRPLQ